MNFNLSYENITTALREYMDKRDIIPGKQFTFRISTGRKGNNICHAIIETLEPEQPPIIRDCVTTPKAIECSKPVQQTTEAIVTKEAEVTVEVVEAPSEEVVEATKEELVKQFFAQKPVPEITEVATEETSKAKPFKKLFAQ